MGANGQGHVPEPRRGRRAHQREQREEAAEGGQCQGPRSHTGAPLWHRCPGPHPSLTMMATPENMTADTSCQTLREREDRVPGVSTGTAPSLVLRAPFPVTSPRPPLEHNQRSPEPPGPPQPPAPAWAGRAASRDGQRQNPPHPLGPRSDPAKGAERGPHPVTPATRSSSRSPCVSRMGEESRAGPVPCQEGQCGHGRSCQGRRRLGQPSSRVTPHSLSPEPQRLPDSKLDFISQYLANLKSKTKDSR